MLLSTGPLSKRPIITAWTKKGHAGLQFQKPISAEELTALLPEAHTVALKDAIPIDPEGSNSCSAPAPRELLRIVHQHLMEAITHLEACTGTDTPSFSTVFNARFQLGQAERQRRITVQSIIGNLAASESTSVAEAISNHQQLRAELNNFRTNYVRTWTPETMQADWRGYRAAKTEKCHKLRLSIEHEQVLFRFLRSTMLSISPTSCKEKIPLSASGRVAGTSLVRPSAR